MLDRRALLRRGAGLVAAAYGWQTVAEASGATHPGLTKLQAAIKGPVLVPSSAGYAQARREYQERFDNIYPLAVVQPLSAADVTQTIAWAKKAKVRLAIRSGGHSYAGYSTTTGIVVDLGRFAGVKLDPATGIAAIGAGARLIDVESVLAASGRAVANGSCPTVGVGGLTLGGGVGFASRKFGTMSDNVVSVGIVTSDGRHLTCNAKQNADLFWACRGGGGGNFGVVTSFGVQTRPAPDVTVFVITWPWSAAATVVAAFQTFAPVAPDELFMTCFLRSDAPTPEFNCSGQFLGSQSELVSLLEPLTAISGASPSYASLSFIDAQMRLAGCAGKTVGQCHLVGETPTGTQPRGSFFAKSDYIVKPLSSAGISTLMQWLSQPAPLSFGAGSVILDSYGGALNRVAPDATAFVHRNALCSAQYIAHATAPSGNPAALAWLRGFYAAMRPYVSGFAYQNYIDPDLATWQHAYYGTNYPRLQKLKAKFDPDWFFRFAQGIAPH